MNYKKVLYRINLARSFRVLIKRKEKHLEGLREAQPGSPSVFCPNDSRRDAILNERDEIFDWTAQVVEDAMLDDLVR